jgi:hypothetical protein|tara:strand:+ start:142 stop:354 length:213 start_codon:yes stop_codon:yes gene_type:complete
MRYVVVVLAFIVGCDSSSSNYSSSSSSEVMTESERNWVVDDMVRQGADRTEADAFTRALNDAQREWEAGN